MECYQGCGHDLSCNESAVRVCVVCVYIVYTYYTMYSFYLHLRPHNSTDRQVQTTRFVKTIYTVYMYKYTLEYSRWNGRIGIRRFFHNVCNNIFIWCSENIRLKIMWCFIIIIMRWTLFSENIIYVCFSVCILVYIHMYAYAFMIVV